MAPFLRRKRSLSRLSARGTGRRTYRLQHHLNPGIARQLAQACDHFGGDRFVLVQNKRHWPFDPLDGLAQFQQEAVFADHLTLVIKPAVPIHRDVYGGIGYPWIVRRLRQPDGHARHENERRIEQQEDRNQEQNADERRGIELSSKDSGIPWKSHGPFAFVWPVIIFTISVEAFSMSSTMLLTRLTR